MQTNPKIIICDCDHENVDTEKELLEAVGIPCKWLHCKTSEEVIEQCQGAVCLINQYARMDEKVFKGIPTLKMISRYGVGVDNVNLDDATRYGVQVCNVPDYGTNEVADQALALMLTLVRKTHLLANDTATGNWNYEVSTPIHRISTQTVGIIGVGRIGTAFALRVKALGCRVVAYDTRPGKARPALEGVVEFCSSIDEVLEQSDIVSLHCGLNDENHKMMNADAFAKMKDGSYLVNVARGGLVDEKALNDALTSGKLAGAGLDVFEKEPIDKNSPLFSHKNVVITPHMAWYSEEAALELKRKVTQEAIRFLQGEPLHYPVNKLEK